MFKGRCPIELDVSLEDFETNPVDIVRKTLGKCLSKHRSNVIEIDHLEDVYRGEQEVLSKARANSEEINNIVVENHIQNIVDFKVGFTVGNPIEYSNTSAKSTNDMDYFGNYLNDCKKSAKDILKYKNIYKYGIAERMVVYRNKKNMDIEKESPFEIIDLDPRIAFVVRESGVRKRTLFSCVISKRLNIQTGRSATFYTIYVENGVFELDAQKNVVMDLKPQDFGGMNPIIEYEANSERMGVIELIESLQNAVNNQDSLQLDDIEEFVNYYIVFKNQNFDDPDFVEKYKQFKKDRVILVKSNNPQLPADVSMLKTSMNHTDLNSLYERFIKAMYNIVAVPLSSGNVTSGGDTGAARLLGNGWETAQNRAEMETTWLDKYEYEEIKRMFTYSKEVANSQIKDLAPSDICITYKINMSDNLYVKTESLKMLYDMKFPKEIALNTCKLTSDSHGVAEKWNEEEERQRDIETSQEVENIKTEKSIIANEK